MTSDYAFAISKLQMNLRSDPAPALTKEKAYLLRSIFPMIAEAAWKGETYCEVLASYMTPHLRHMLDNLGYVIKDGKHNQVFNRIEWCEQVTYEGDSEQLVSSSEFVKLIARLDEAVFRGRGHEY